MADRADLVVIGAGTIGGWASVFARADGVGRVVVVERGLAGMGASTTFRVSNYRIQLVIFSGCYMSMAQILGSSFLITKNSEHIGI